MVSVSSLIAVAFISSRSYGDRSTHSSTSVLQEQLNECSQVDNPIVLSTSTIELPLFPLRKFVRVPTDTLSVNLYEERYLAMSEYILDQSSQMFGAIYSSDKPQIVKGGVGPIVPLLGVGDVGLICVVDEWYDDMVPTRDITYNRRRIKLNAVAVSRFQIEEIIDDGMQQPYFIRAKVSVLKDAPLSVSEEDSDLNSIENDVRKKVISKEGMEAEASTNALIDKLVSLASIEGYSEKEQRDEAFSFVATKLLSPENPSPEMIQKLLQVTNTKDRFQRILEWR